MIGESRGHWYLRQMLGSANFDAVSAMRFMSGERPVFRYGVAT